MSVVSNRFFVEAIEDGSTLHGTLVSDKSLAQAFTGTSCVPNWEESANQPTIYVDLLNGSDHVAADSTGVWEYNGTAITWNGNTSTDGRFQKVTDLRPEGYTTYVPAIKIISNLATSSNVNTDSITYRGSYTLSGSAIDFSLTTFVRITSVSATGIFGIIEFIGSNIITEDHPIVSMRARLFDASNTELASSQFTTAWTMNGVSIGAGSTITVDGTSYPHGKQVADDSSYGISNVVIDNAIIGCTFTKTADGSVYTAYESVDDQTDPEILMIYTAGAEGNSRQLHRGQEVLFQFWMAKVGDSTPDTTWTNFKVKLNDADGTEVTDPITGIPNVGADGYRPLTWDGSAASLTITYDVARSVFKKYLTGFIYASNQ